jgi:pyruvate/2-oxoglutarate/acetoin dehydrogenase E1 component
MFWEALNAIGVLKSPAVVTIYDDGYGISVPNEYQMIKEDIGALLGGFQRKPDSDEGFDIYRIHGWNYPRLVEAYQQAGETARRDHIPAILHIIELTQPQGHSTSGSHERYKSPERLQWEQEFDGIRRMRSWISEMGLASPAELDKLEKDERTLVEEERKRAWQAFSAPILAERQKALEMISQLSHRSQQARPLLEKISANLVSNQQPLRRDTMAAVHQALRSLRDEEVDGKSSLVTWKRQQEEANEERYGSHLYSRSPQAARLVTVIPPVYSESSPLAYGYEVINACFDQALAREPLLVAFGEDVGRLGDVNQGFRGMQEKYGVLRVADTGIREVTIMGQAIGLALRGLRPIAEIQYLDYLLYALQLMSDDLATLHWRTAGGQKAPVIVRTRGHRLEGIWHSGSHMAGMLGLLRGMHLLTPRDMTRAAGFYNTLLLSDEPAVVVEVLNGYRVRERMPDNIGALILPIGVPEVLRPGQDLTIVTYGACCRIVMEAAESLDQVGITAEVIDVQSLLPFDLPGIIGESLQKTNRILFVDEDMPGGATAYMLQEVLEKQNGYFWLDSPPRTLAARPHRPAYGSDGDYWSKPNAEQVFDAAYAIMHEVDPARYPLFTH